VHIALVQLAVNFRRKLNRSSDLRWLGKEILKPIGAHIRTINRAEGAIDVSVSP